MNNTIRKSIFWGAVITSMTLVISLFFNLFGGNAALASGFHEHDRGSVMVLHKGFGHEQMVASSHHGIGLSWIWFLLILTIGLTVLFLAVKGLRKKSRSASMEQFIDSSLISSPRPLINNNNASILDEWEKNITNKKERL